MNLEDRFAIHHNLPDIGIEGQINLQKAKIAVVGLGGLGSHIVLGLVSLGIGHITLIDDDIITGSNLSRQTLYTEADIGLSKTVVAASRLEQRNSKIEYNVLQQRLTTLNAEDLLYGQDIIIDGTDNIASRMVIDKFCNKHNIPMIYGGVKGFMGQVSVFNFNSGKSFCASFANLEDLFSEENCNDSGVIFPLVSIVSNIQVMQALNIILKKQPVLQGTLQVVDLINLKFRQFQLF